MVCHPATNHCQARRGEGELVRLRKFVPHLVYHGRDGSAWSHYLLWLVLGSVRRTLSVAFDVIARPSMSNSWCHASLGLLNCHRSASFQLALVYITGIHMRASFKRMRIHRDLAGDAPVLYSPFYMDLQRFASNAQTKEVDSYWAERKQDAGHYQSGDW